jgi:hypothetical protein
LRLYKNRELLLILTGEQTESLSAYQVFSQK